MEDEERHICVIFVYPENGKLIVEPRVLYMSRKNGKEKYMTFEPEIRVLNEDFSDIELKWLFTDKIVNITAFKDINIDTSINEITKQIKSKTKNTKHFEFYVFDLDTYNPKQLYEFVFTNIIHKYKLKSKTENKIRDIYYENRKKQREIKDDEEKLDSLIKSLLLISACIERGYIGRKYIYITDRYQGFYLNIFKLIFQGYERDNSGVIESTGTDTYTFSGDSINPPLIDTEEDKIKKKSKIEKKIEKKINIWTILFLYTNHTHSGYNIRYVPVNRLKLKLENVYDYLKNSKSEFINLDDIFSLTNDNEIFEDVINKIEVTDEIEKGTDKYKITRTICIKIDW